MRNTAIEANTKKILEEGFENVEKFDTEKGGIYVETTDDFRGWMLGDKTRKIYKIPDLYVKTLTDLLVVIFSNDDEGSEIRVIVYNPQDTARMLLSKNDDVGSSVQYAHIDVHEPAELVAKMGCHICIESLMRGSWIRLRIFPGSDILELINDNDSEMLKFLEFCKRDANETLVELTDRYYAMQEDIETRLSKLESYGKDCTCDEPLVFKHIFEGKFDEIFQTCLNCGGTIVR